MSEENGTKRKISESESDDAVSKKAKIPDKEAGRLLFSGLTNYVDRNEKGTANTSIKWSPHRFESLEGVRIRDVSSGPVSYFFLAISEEGKVYACGLNERGQLGMDDYKNRRNPALIEALEDYNVVAVATGRQHALFLTDRGNVFSCGDNKCGQCGVGSKAENLNLPSKIDYSGSPITKIACGDDFSLILNEAGEVFSFGNPEHGQLGHGTENKEIAKRKEIFHYQYSPALISAYIEVDPDNNDVIPHGKPTIVDIACGINHSCAIDDDQRLFTWGFGGYGRLGHSNTRNEMLPRLMKSWYKVTGRADGGVVKVFCGGQFNFVHTIIPKCTYMFGQYHRNSEANMYPKFVEDLQGWNIRCVVCSQFGYIVCADDCLIASQPSPGFGTLGMGEKMKASAQPRIITTLKDVYCYRAGLGYMHSLYIVRDDTEKDKEAIEKFPLMSFDESEMKEVKEKENGNKKGKPKAKPKPKKKK